MEKPLIYVVDDDADFLDLLRLMLNDDSKIKMFSDPNEALKFYLKEKPSVIVSDINMPGLHGIAFKSIVEELNEPKQFIFMSANSIEEVESKFGSLGESRFFKKPLDDEFIEFISGLTAR